MEVRRGIFQKYVLPADDFPCLSVSDAGEPGHADQTLGAGFRHRSIVHRRPDFDRSDRSRSRLRTSSSAGSSSCIFLSPAHAHSPPTTDPNVRPPTSAPFLHRAHRYFAIRIANAARMYIFPVLLPTQGFLVSDAVKKGDIYRVVNGYDDCANVCGRVTPGETDPQFSCKGADKTNER